MSDKFNKETINKVLNQINALGGLTYYNLYELEAKYSESLSIIRNEIENIDSRVLLKCYLLDEQDKKYPNPEAIEYYKNKIAYIERKISNSDKLQSELNYVRFLIERRIA